jgi:predicted dehydrogenase
LARNVRIGLIGCGGHGLGVLAPAIEAVEGAELTACTDVDEAVARRAEERLGLSRHHTDYRDMLLVEDLDAVVVALPHHLLRDASLAAIGEGLHVFVEKPMALTRADGEQIRDAARSAGVTVMVGYCQRYDEGRRTMKALIERGAVGDIAVVNAAKGCPPLTGWLADPATGGGELLWLGVHITDQVLWMAGSTPERVTGEIVWHPRTGADQSAVFTIRFESGVLANVLCSQNVAGGLDFIEVLGSAGRIRAEWPSGVVWVYSEAVPEYKHPTTIRPRTPQTANMYRDEMRAWGSSMVDSRPPPIDASAGVRVLSIIDAVFESARTGALVSP